MVIIIDLADLDSAEVVCKVFEAHPKASIIGIFVEADLLFQSWSPAITAVAPVAGPLKVTPRVSQLDQLNFISELVCDDFCCQKSIRVLSHKAELLKSFSRSFS